MIFDPITLAAVLCLATFAATGTATVLTSAWQNRRAPVVFTTAVLKLGVPANSNRPPRRFGRPLGLAWKAKD